ncbi:uncharacterized [Tachysurus ichikawai]
MTGSFVWGVFNMAQRSDPRDSNGFGIIYLSDAARLALQSRTMEEYVGREQEGSPWQHSEKSPAFHASPSFALNYHDDIRLILVDDNREKMSLGLVILAVVFRGKLESQKAETLNNQAWQPDELLTPCEQRRINTQHDGLSPR